MTSAAVPRAAHKDINKVLKEIEPIIGHVNLQITMDDILKSIMKTFNMKDVCFEELKIIYNICKKGSSIFNSARPETLAYGIVFYYLSKYLPEFNQDAYFESAGVSKDTILNFTIEITKYLPT